MSFLSIESIFTFLKVKTKSKFIRMKRLNKKNTLLMKLLIKKTSDDKHESRHLETLKILYFSKEGKKYYIRTVSLKK